MQSLHARNFFQIYINFAFLHLVCHVHVCCVCWIFALCDNSVQFRSHFCWCLFDSTEMNWMEEICYVVHVELYVYAYIFHSRDLRCSLQWIFATNFKYFCVKTRLLFSFSYTLCIEFFFSLWFKLNVFSLVVRWRSRQIDIKPLINYFSWILAIVMLCCVLLFLFFSFQKF